MGTTISFIFLNLEAIINPAYVIPTVGVKWIHEWIKNEGMKVGRDPEGGREELTGMFKIKQSVIGVKRILIRISMVPW